MSLKQSRPNQADGQPDHNLTEDQSEAETQENTWSDDASEDELAEEPILSKSATPEVSEELAESKDRLLRLAAEYDNYRKRTIREKDELARYASASLMEKLLPVLDTIERGVLFNEKAESLDSVREGLVKVHRQLFDILEREGLGTIAEAGEPFDANLHMAVMQEASDQYPDQTVIQVFEKGYRLKDKILRHAKVKVSTEG
jgi:molecular chaperone GrpE